MQIIVIAKDTAFTIRPNRLTTRASLFIDASHHISCLDGNWVYAKVPVGNARLKELADRAKMREDKWLAALGTALGLLSETTGWKCTLDAKGQVRVSKKDEHLAEPVKLDPESLDGCLFEAWLDTLSMEQLEKEVKKLGYPLSRLNLATPPEMRNRIRGLLLCRPSLLERQLVRLRSAEEDI